MALLFDDTKMRRSMQRAVRCGANDDVVASVARHCGQAAGHVEAPHIALSPPHTTYNANTLALSCTHAHVHGQQPEVEILLQIEVPKGTEDSIDWMWVVVEDEGEREDF